MVLHTIISEREAEVNRNCIFHFFSNAIILTEVCGSKINNCKTFNLWQFIFLYDYITGLGRRWGRDRDSGLLPHFIICSSFLFSFYGQKDELLPEIFADCANFVVFQFNPPLDQRQKLKEGEEKKQKMYVCVKKKSQKLTTVTLVIFQVLTFLNILTAT